MQEIQYAIGEHVVHPAHGAGTIVDIQEQDWIEDFKEYYVIQFTEKNLTVSIPVRRTKQIGLRDVMTSDKYDQVLATLCKRPKQLPKDHKDRKYYITDLIQSGRPVKVAEALRELTWRRIDKHLTMADSRLLDQARTMLVQEISLATDTDPREIESAIDAALLEAVAKREGEEEKTH